MNSRRQHPAQEGHGVLRAPEGFLEKPVVGIRRERIVGHLRGGEWRVADLIGVANRPGRFEDWRRIDGGVAPSLRGIWFFGENGGVELWSIGGAVAEGVSLWIPLGRVLHGVQEGGLMIDDRVLGVRRKRDQPQEVPARWLNRKSVPGTRR